MSILAKRREVAVRFSDFSGGVNLSEDSTRINRNQVQLSSNAILRKNGILRRPGSIGLSSFDLAGYVKGFYNYLDFNGNERFLAGSGGKIYSLNKTTGASTEEYNLTGTGDFYFATALGKCWVTNGTKVAKGEGDDWYQVGITAPTGATAAASAGGTLPDGSYEVYISYGRDVGGTIVLYSAGQYLGPVVLGSGNNTVRISDFALSTDPQVNKRVVWMSDAGGSTIYRYYVTTNTGSTTVDVASNSTREESILYSIWAVNNAAVPAFEYIHSGDGRIWGSVSNRLYYSLRNTSNAYDLERFFPLNYIDFPHVITGIFSVGPNLYVNTPAGIYAQPSHDVTARFIWIEKRWRFAFMNTVVDHSGGKLGLTNDGVKFFDGEKFYDYDISENVKSEISKIYQTTSGFAPFGIIIRRDIRTEYHLFYNDVSLSSHSNNSRLVLNLDKLQYLPDKAIIAPWEIWTNSATHAIITQAGIPYYIQSHVTAPKMYKEVSTSAIDDGLYLNDGTLGDTTSKIHLCVETRTELLDMSGRIAWSTMRVMVRLSSAVTIQLYLRDVEGKISASTLSSGETVSLWDVFEWDVGAWASSTPSLRKISLPTNMHSYMMYLKIMQTADDPELNILDATVEGIMFSTRFT